MPGLFHLLLQGATLLLLLLSDSSDALDGDTSRIRTFNGWKAIEVITEGDSRGSSWRMPDKFDGAGAFLLNDDIIRIHVNHEKDMGEASISEVNIDKRTVKQAISNMIRNNNIGGLRFVRNARLAYERYTEDGGASFQTMVNPPDTNFCRLCSSQAYAPNSFGENRGFVDQLYITGEECPRGRLFVLDSRHKVLHKLSGFTGSSNDSRGGMPVGKWENAALLDTGETNFIALLLSPDGGGNTNTEFMQLYVGHKGKNRHGRDASDFLSRNGLAYGEYFYLKANFPSTGDTNDGSFKKDTNGGLGDTKLEDVDTNPNDPTLVILAEQNRGLFTLDFDLRFNNEGINSGGSSFTITKIPSDDIRGPDNVEWSADGRIFVNEDSGRGAVWHTTDNGSSRTKIGETTAAGESSGIFDFSEFVDYPPGHVMITTNMSPPSSMTILISPRAEPGPSTSREASPPDDAVVLEAEDATMTDARIERVHSPYIGDGYVDMLRRGASIQWEIAGLDAGAYEVSVAYASATDRPAYFVVDGMRRGEFNFVETRSWADWTVETKVFMLDQGDHQFMISADQSIGPNIDWLAYRFVPIVNPQLAPDGSNIYEAEEGLCELCEIQTTHSGFTGSGYADFRREGAYLQLTLEITEATTYDIRIRYAAASDRPADFVLDGDKESDLLFERTGGWNTWATESVSMVSLTEGVHILKVDCGEKSSGPNVDWIALRKSRRRTEEVTDSSSRSHEVLHLRGR